MEMIVKTAWYFKMSRLIHTQIVPFQLRYVRLEGLYLSQLGALQRQLIRAKNVPF
jgi:hypothetical protein